MSTITEEEYIKPPSYNETTNKNICTTLLNKIKERIQRDLTQINHIYDCQINDNTNKKNIEIQKINSKYDKIIIDIENNRNKEIQIYNSNAEKSIDNIINTLNENTKEKKFSVLKFLGII